MRLLLLLSFEGATWCQTNQLSQTLVVITKKGKLRLAVLRTDGEGDGFTAPLHLPSRRPPPLLLLLVASPTDGGPRPRPRWGRTTYSYHISSIRRLFRGSEQPLPGDLLIRGMNVGRGFRIF